MVFYLVLMRHIDSLRLPVQVRFKCGREISPTIEALAFDKYRISTLPSKKDLIQPAGEEGLLEFLDTWQEGQNASNPEKEAEYVLAWLSLVFGMKVEFDSAKINNVNAARRGRIPPPKIDADPGLDALFVKLRSLDERGVRQYLRACETYRIAMSMMDDDPTLAMFLLVTSVECLSNSFATGEGIFDRFRAFVLSYLPAELESEREDQVLFEALLRACYDYRSGFTHGGRPLSLAAEMADQVQRRYVRHFTEGREVVTPGLKWFAKLVQAVLVEFLRRQTDEIQTSLGKLAIQESVLRLRAKRPTEAGRVVTSEDIDLG